MTRNKYVCSRCKVAKTLARYAELYFTPGGRRICDECGERRLPGTNERAIELTPEKIQWLLTELRRQWEHYPQPEGWVPIPGEVDSFGPTRADLPSGHFGITTTRKKRKSGAISQGWSAYVQEDGRRKVLGERMDLDACIELWHEYHAGTGKVPPPNKACDPNHPVCSRYLQESK